MSDLSGTQNGPRSGRRIGRRAGWGWAAVWLLLGALETQAFVFYLVADRFLMRWTPETGSYPATVVNPSTKRIRYYLASDAFSATNRTAELEAIRSAFDVWEGTPGAKVRFEDAGLLVPPANKDLDTYLDNTNTVFWVKRGLLVGGGFENMSGRRAWTSVTFSFDDGRILETDTVLNGLQYGWFTDFESKTNTAQFIEGVMLHEIGHVLGLDHSPGGGATMANGPDGIGTLTGLSADEIAAARYLYPDGVFKGGMIRGMVTLNGAGILGAVVVAEDGDGNLAGATVTRADGTYELRSLTAGTYALRVSPLDPKNTVNALSLMRGDEVAIDYVEAVTGFLPTTNMPITLASGETKTRDVPVTAGTPLRITALSPPGKFVDSLKLNRVAMSIPAGTSNLFFSVAGPALAATATLTVSGSGITLSPTIFKANAGPGLNSLTAVIGVAHDAKPGLRTLTVVQGANRAYAHGYLDVAPAIPDDNLDGFDDAFQRRYWPRWTAPDAKPGADSDGDRFSNAYEAFTGTNPTNRLSVSFLIDSVTTTSQGATVAWKADVGKKYRLHGRAAFGAETPWAVVAGPLTATAQSMTVLDPKPATGALPEKFYWLELVP